MKVLIVVVAAGCVTAGCSVTDILKRDKPHETVALITAPSASDEVGIAAGIARDMALRIDDSRSRRPATPMVMGFNRTPMAAALKGELERLGYRFQREGAPGEADAIAIFEEQQHDANGKLERRVEVVIGNLVHTRRYRLEGDRAEPIGMMTVQYLAGDPANTASGIPEEQLATVFASVDRPAETSGWETRIAMEEVTPTEAAPPLRRNMRDIDDRSNYEGAFEDTEIVQEVTLVFPNDSLLLGAYNKKLISRMLNDFNDETDLLSVVGCSHGKTELEMKDGNAYLALGRANRVAEELMMSEIDSSKIFDEGCWANRRYSDMPLRGVVLTQRRSTS